MTHDLVTLGEAMLRLWVPAGERLEDAPAYRVTVAGAEANVAMAAARMGVSAAWLSRLPDSPLGKRAAREIAGHGVDVSHVVWDGTMRMGTYFVELSVPPRSPTVVYDRAGSAAAGMAPEDVAWEVVESARAVHLSGITPALSSKARATAMEVAHRARRAGAAVIVDVNYRSRLWSTSEAAGVIGDLCSEASVVIATAEDARDLFGLDEPAAAAAASLRRSTGAETAIVTEGAAGAAWESADGEGSAPGHEAVVVDRIGAGDAFAAGVAIGLLEGDIPSGVERGLAMAALKLGIHGDQLVASPQEVEAVMRGGSQREVRR